MNRMPDFKDWFEERTATPIGGFAYSSISGHLRLLANEVAAYTQEAVRRMEAAQADANGEPRSSVVPGSGR